jgi:hypothetical protein
MNAEKTNAMPRLAEPNSCELKLLRLAQHLVTDRIEGRGAEQRQAAKRQKCGVGSSIVQIEKSGAEEAEIAEHGNTFAFRSFTLAIS